MNWKRIPKENTVEPKKGTYSDWKEILADEGFNHCVYCTIHEGSFGRRNYHVEHYKPKGLAAFKKLENTFSNLFFSCCICNCFKGSFWEEPLDDHSNSCFPDPSIVDYSILFELLPDSSLKGLNTSGKFIIEKLYLNRPQLLLERRIITLLNRLKISFNTFANLKDDLKKSCAEGNADAQSFLFTIVDLFENLNKIQVTIRETVPYTSNDVTKK